MCGASAAVFLRRADAGAVDDRGAGGTGDRRHTCCRMNPADGLPPCRPGIHASASGAECRRAAYKSHQPNLP